MGFFDSIKKALGGVAQEVAHAPRAQYAPASRDVGEVEEEEDTVSNDVFDVAGFDPVGDEGAFFNAVLHMESEGAMGGTDASRAEIMQRYGIRNRSHWRDVKDACYRTLVPHHGSMEVVSQREMNFRMGRAQSGIQANIAARAASGELSPVEGVTLDAWAAINASIVQGSSLEDLLKGAAIDRARWDRVSAEWNARMGRDTTAAIATVYGNAFQNASKGKYGEYAREANAARTANRDLKLEPPITLERYYEIMYEQAYASKQGRDAAQALKDMGLTIIDWTDIGCFMGYHFHRTAGLRWKEYEAVLKGVQQKFQAKYPGIETDVDITF
jgi:hypothetical protein